ncbi:uncharacterized protein PEZ65_018781 isoform 2-T3 [Lycodopsis pacificus]
MSKVQMLRCLVNQRLTAAAEEIFGVFERTIAEYEEELCRSKEQNERQRKLLDAVFIPQLRLHRADVQQLLVVKEEVPPEQQEWRSSLDQEDPEPPHIKDDQESPEPPHIKEEQEYPEPPHIKEEQEYPEPPHIKEVQEYPEPPHIKEVQEYPEPPHIKEEQEDPEAPHIKEEQEDPEPPHIKEDQKDPEPPHIKEEQEELWTSQEGEQLQGLEEADITKFTFTPVKSEDDEEEAQSSQLQRQTEQMETETDGEDCGGPEPERNSDPDRHPEPDTNEKTGDSSDTDDSGDWKETRKPQSGLNSVNNDEVPVSDSRCSADVQQLLVAKEEQQEWSSSLDQDDPEPPHIKEEQEELWTSQEGEQLRGLEEADIKFSFTPVKSEDDEEEAQSSQLHQRQTEQMETEADGEDCGGPEPERNSDPDRHPEPDTNEKTGDSSDTDDSGDWKETREPQSGLNSVNNDEVPVSDSRCSADVQQLLVVKEEQQEWSSSLDQEDPEPPHIKEEQEDPEPPHIQEEQEEHFTSQEGEHLQGLEEADITNFSFTPVKTMKRKLNPQSFIKDKPKRWRQKLMERTVEDQNQRGTRIQIDIQNQILMRRLETLLTLMTVVIGRRPENLSRV